MKRLLSIFLCIALIISALVSTIPLSATSPASIVIGNGECKPGESAKIDVYLDSNPGMMYLLATPVVVGHGSDPLEGVSIEIENGEIFEEFAYYGNMLFYNSTDTTATGKLCTLTVKVDEDFAVGKNNTYNISVKIRECYDDNEKSVAVNATSGLLTILCPHKGETELRGAKKACVKEGYTGDTYCLVCEKKIKSGEPIPATGKHNFVDFVCDACGEIETLPDSGIVGSVESVTLTRESTEVSLAITADIRVKSKINYLSLTPVITDMEGKSVPEITITKVRTGLFDQAAYDGDIILSSDENVWGVGVIADISIHVPLSVPNGDYKISLIVQSCKNSDGEDIVPEFEAGTLTVAPSTTPKDYTISFIDWDHTVISQESYKDGETVVIPAAPARESDEDNIYVFAGWDVEVSTVASGNKIYKATYTAYPKETTPYIYVENARGVVGKTAEVQVFIKNNPSFTSATFALVFDSALTLKEVKANGIAHEDDKIIFADTDLTEDGLLFTLVFEIPEGTESGEYEISSEITSCSNRELRFVLGGTLKVYNSDYGDATGDSLIDNKDLVRIKKYLAAYDYETESSSVEIFDGADATGDGIIDNKDLVRLKKYLAAYDYDTGTSTVPLG